MSEVKIDSGWNIVQEFSDGPTLMCLGYAFQRTIRKEKGGEIYCVEDVNNKKLLYHIQMFLCLFMNLFCFGKIKDPDGSKRKVFFHVVSLFRIVNRKNVKGEESRTIEVDVVRSKDDRKGRLVFIEGHRNATFFESPEETKRIVMAHSYCSY